MPARAHSATNHQLSVRTAIDPDERWFFERFDVVHDLLHVLTGYGRDEAGEAANLAFTLAQFPTRGVAILVLAAALIGPKDWRVTWPRYLYRAWRRGRRAVCLTVVPYEVLLPLPLEDVRTLLGIQPAAEAHPLGIIAGPAPLRHRQLGSPSRA